MFKVSTPERKRSKSRSDFSMRSCGDTHCVSKPVRPTGGTNWSEDVKNIMTKNKTLYSVSSSQRHLVTSISRTKYNTTDKKMVITSKNMVFYHQYLYHEVFSFTLNVTVLVEKLQVSS